MNATIYIQIISMVYIILIMIVYFSKERLKSIENNIFKILLISNFIGLIIDIICAFATYRMTEPSFINYLITKLYLIYFIVWISMFSVYTFAISKNDTNKVKLNLKINIVLLILFSWITLLLPLDFNKNNNGMFAEGTAVNFIYIIVGIYIVLCIIYLIKNIKNIINKKYIPLLSFLLLGIIVMYIQKNNPSIILIPATETFVTFLMYFTIENPDMKLINELELAKNSAEKANHAKTEFLSSMSHEIRTPLNAIVGLSEIINKTDNLTEIHEDSKDVVNASYTLLEIVNSILDISKIEAGKMEIVKVNYSPKDEVEKLSKLLETRIGSKDLKLYVTVDENIPHVLYGDLNKVKQIISNLLSNAIKYTESGRVDLIIESSTKDNICTLKIIVKDTGRGIKSEQLSHLFTKFDRLEEDKNTSIEGTGLGLAITKSLVEMLNGSINVESTYGVGSIFTVTLPEEVSNEVLENTLDEQTTKYNEVKSLIVDDSKLNLKVAEKILSEYGLTSDIVTSGNECINKIKEGNKYDLIFMDIMMPDKNGVETLKELKNINGFNTPVIALTADAMEGQKEAYIKEGFTSYLSKPIDKTELESLLKNILNKNITKNEIQKKDQTSSSKEEILTSAGFDLTKSYEYFMDIDTLITQLKEYLSESTENKKTMENSLNNLDDINYEIVVHKLKSESRMLGLTSLGEMFYNHELKAKEKDWNYIKENYENLINEYNKVLNTIQNL